VKGEEQRADPGVNRVDKRDPGEGGSTVDGVTTHEKLHRLVAKCSEDEAARARLVREREAIE
jgi:hypothetical protein